MMNRVYYLSTCDTCKRILKELEADFPSLDLERIDIKVHPLSEAQIDEIYNLTGSYESFFSKVCRKYKELGLKDKGLDESGFKSYLLEHYTFLKRPVFLMGSDTVFVGNSKKNIQALKDFLSAN